MSSFDVIGGVNRKVKKRCATIEGVHRKIKSRYATVDGVYRKVWSGELNMYVAVSWYGKLVAFSEDGITWSSQAVTLDGGATVFSKIKSLCYGNGIFVATMQSGSNYVDMLAYSEDGVNYFTSGTTVTGYEKTYFRFAYGKGKFVAQHPSTSAIYYSSDGKNWTLISGTYKSKVKFLNNKFVRCAGELKDAWYYSDDGVTWATVESNFSTSSRTIKDLTYFAGKYIGVCNDNYSLVYSTDLINWTVASNYYNSSSLYPYAAETNGKVAVFVGGSKYDDDYADGWYYESGTTVNDGTGLTNGGYKFDVDDEEITAPYSLLVYHDKFVCAQGYGEVSGRYLYNTCAYSLDGKTWTEFKIFENGVGGLTYAGS